jgi:hypothetical protein
LAELQRLVGELKEANIRLTKMEITVAVLKGNATLLGALAGVVVSLVANYLAK